MPNYKIIFHRDVVETDEVVRGIEAESIEAASDRAAEMADEFDSNCPDDVETIAGGECQSWYPEATLETDDDVDVDDLNAELRHQSQ